MSRVGASQAWASPWAQACPPKEERRWEAAGCGVNSPCSSSWLLSRHTFRHQQMESILLFK